MPENGSVPPDVAAVVVRGARLPAAPGDAAFSVLTIDPVALRSAIRLDEALATAPGFSLFRRTSSLGANPTTQGISLRGIAGSGASRALVTLDGVPQNDPFGGWVIWTALPSETISAATVVRGAGAGPYGAGALTGVVALQSPDAVDGGFGGDASVGTLGYRRAGGVAEVHAGATSLIANAAGEDSGGWIPVRDGRGGTDRPLTLRDWTGALKLQQNLGAATLAARIAGFEEYRGSGTLDANARERGGQASLTLAAQPSPERLGWRLQGWIDTSNLANTSATLSADRNTATLANDQYSTPAVGFGFNGAVRRVSAASSLEVGVDLRAASGESREHLYSLGVRSGERTSGGKTLVAGLYGEGSRTFGPWLVTGGVRVDGWSDFDGKLVQTGAAPLDDRPEGEAGVAPTGRLGVRRALPAGLYLRAAGYAGFRPATLNELHRSFRLGADVTEANAALSPERLYGAEAAIGGEGATRWQATAFYNRLEDAITNVTLARGPGTFPIAGFVPAGGTLFERQNAGVVNAAGIEAEASRALSPELQMRIAADYTHARVDGGSAALQLTGLRPAETPAFTATATATWRPTDRVTVFADTRYESDRFDDDQNTRRIKAGVTVNGRAEWRARGEVRLYIAADNLFDAAVQTGRSAADIVTYDAPRLVRIGVTLRR